jgi:hypothetical protein
LGTVRVLSITGILKLLTKSTFDHGAIEKYIPIPILSNPILHSPGFTVPQIRARAENLALPARDDNALDSVVDVKQAKDVLQLLAHGIGKGIVPRGAVKREHDDGSGRGRAGRVVGELQCRERECGVGGWQWEGWWWRGHCDLHWLKSAEVV